MHQPLVSCKIFSALTSSSSSLNSLSSLAVVSTNVVSADCADLRLRGRTYDDGIQLNGCFVQSRRCVVYHPLWFFYHFWLWFCEWTTKASWNSWNALTTFLMSHSSAPSVVSLAFLFSRSTISLRYSLVSLRSLSFFSLLFFTVGRWSVFTFERLRIWS